jgi:alpha-tubulin suppressor-like RCC1 family protein
MAQIYEWGLNNNGQLGDGTTGVGKPTPALLQGIPPLPVGLNVDNIKSISCGQNHTILLTKDGFVYSVGYNANGQLGNGSVVSSKNFALCTNIDNIQGTIKAVSCGSLHTMVLTNSGKIYGTGQTDFGQLGIGTNVPNQKNIFTLSSFNFSEETVQSISCGSTFTAVLTTSGKLYTTGYNFYGQLGLGNTQNQLSFTLCNSISNVESIHTGQNHIMVLTKDGKIHGCGYNSGGSLGINSSVSSVTTFTLSTFNSDFPQEVVSNISCGGFHTLVSTNSGKVYGTGSSAYGQLGSAVSTNIKFALCPDVENIQGSIKNVHAYIYHTLLITNSGKIYMSGYGGNGQLGNGTTQYKYVFTPIVTADINTNFSWTSDGTTSQTIFAYKAKIEKKVLINPASSSAVHLYDSVNNDLYNVTTFSERVEHNAGSKAQHFHGSTVMFYNKNGTNTSSDVVADLNVLKAGLVSDLAYTDAAASTESSARVAVDTSITAFLNTATANRTATDYSLQNTVSANKASVVAAVASAVALHTSTDAELKATLDAEKATFSAASASLRADLTSEATRAVAAEQKESADSVAADASLRADLTSEASRAVASEQKESDNRSSADSSISTQLEQRIVDRVALVQVERERIDAILANNSVDLNKLKEIVEAYKSLDTKQATEITALTATCALLQTQVTTLKSKIDLALVYTASDVRVMGKK